MKAFHVYKYRPHMAAHRMVFPRTVSGMKLLHIRCKSKRPLRAQRESLIPGCIKSIVRHTRMPYRKPYAHLL